MPHPLDSLLTAYQHLLPKHQLSRLVGKLADSESPPLKNFLIKRFAHAYNVNLSEAEFSQPDQYRSFNHFFTRALKSGARIIDPDPAHIVSPVDGTVSQLGKIVNGEIFQAKGRSYSAQELLAGDNQKAAQFANGEFITIYLSPTDYHRIHMPIAGQLISTDYVPGELFSVNPRTARSVDRLFARNERLICYFDTDIGLVALVLVGAVIVAGIESVWHGRYQPNPSTISHEQFQTPPSLVKGEEMGRFYLGSTIVLLLPENNLSWNKQLHDGSVVRLGQKIACAN